MDPDGPFGGNSVGARRGIRCWPLEVSFSPRMKAFQATADTHSVCLGGGAQKLWATRTDGSEVERRPQYLY